ncbi:MAG: hypothetical protein HY955_00590 [Deltaproteobacteria bacterium]|nr:hypothetical protein [Deltaproteobacteria bacterium]
MPKKPFNGVHGRVILNGLPMRPFILAALVLCAFACISPASAIGADTTGWLFSPGELSKKHAKYEGMGNCTLCHTVGSGVTDAKCLECHDNLAERINRNEGVHARFKDPCITCHAEHQGKDHSLINIKEKEFKHDLTGFILKGKHTALECRKCHKTQGVYSGQVRECVSCHKDKHEKQLGTDCAKCHEPEGWKEKLKFSHDKDSRFTLKGAHTKLSCAKCHVNGRFKLEYNSCGTSDCHGDKHKGQFGRRECTECHKSTMEKWDLSDSFDHSVASFVLKGKHAKLVCAKCHVNKRFKPLEHSTCGAANCHGDRHKGQFGQKECTECHSKTIESWSARDTVEHWKMNFRLRGRHDQIECTKCHVNGKFKSLEHGSCGIASCHGDFHKGQTNNKACTFCHLDDIVSWKIRGIFDHSRVSEFELKGRHAKLECGKCHKKGHLKPLEHGSCGVANCHGDRHKGQTGDKPCLECHDKASFNWRIYKDFDHAVKTGFELKGKHLKVECAKCHAKGHLKPLEHKTCGGEGCHFHDHRKKVEGKTCADCHDRDSSTWNVPSEVFDHGKEAKYALAGRHAEVWCSQCHKSGKFKFEGCVSCHGPKDPHEKLLGAKCDKCHTPEGWKKTSFDHDRDTTFPLVREHAVKECIRCHSTKVFADTPKKCESCHGKTGSGNILPRYRNYDGMP